MPSPFPGMNPYIEHPDIWSDFHSDLAGEIRTRLNQQIPPRYVAKITPRVSYEVVQIGQSHLIRPDVGVVQPVPPTGNVAVLTRSLTKEPVESEVEIEGPLRLYSVEVYETGSFRLVTAIEILSPINKRPSQDAYHEYLRKRRDLLRSQANFLELDLLRGGTRPPLNKPVPPAPYYITLSRVALRPRVEVWPIQLWEELPTIPVPLLDPDPDAILELNQLVKDVYERGAYHVLIDYNQSTPPPALDRADQAWVERLLRERA